MLFAKFLFQLKKKKLFNCFGYIPLREGSISPPNLMENCPTL